MKNIRVEYLEWLCFTWNSATFASFACFDAVEKCGDIIAKTQVFLGKSCMQESITSLEIEE